jgi:hypothetical protein
LVSQLVNQISYNYESHTMNSQTSNTSVLQTNDVKVALYDVSTYTFVDKYQRFGEMRWSVTLKMEASATCEMLKLSLLMLAGSIIFLRQVLCTRLHGIISHKTVTFTVIWNKPEAAVVDGMFCFYTHVRNLIYFLQFISILLRKIPYQTVDCSTKALQCSFTYGGMYQTDDEAPSIKSARSSVTFQTLCR